MMTNGHMTAKDFFLEQLSAVRTQKNWLVPSAEALDGLTAEQAKKSDGSGGHSIWQIVNHLAFWNGRLLAHFRGEVPPKMEGNNSGTFNNDNSSPEDWENARKRLDESLAELEEAVKNTGEAALQQEAFKGYGESWLQMFAQVTIHNAYHIGQIVQLRKQNGWWDSKQGVE